MNAEKTRVLIAGGGVAGLEALMALNDLAPEQVELRLMAPDPDFVLKPLSVGEPFAVDHVQRYSLADAAAEFGGTYIQDALARVDPAGHTATGASGTDYAYDRLIVTVGAQPYPAFADALTFGIERDPTALNGILADIEGGFSKSVAFVLPTGVTWPLPLYELALMTARQVRGMGIDDARILLVTPERAPLAIFGEEASAAVKDFLDQARIEVVAGSPPDVRSRRVLNASGLDEEVDRIVTLPRLRGPRIAGLPHGDDGFLPVDEFGRVVGAEGVFAAGDGADFPIKQGGLAAQQADAVAGLIASEAGAGNEAKPFHPVLRGRLMTGPDMGEQFLRGEPEGSASDASATALWWPPTKVAGRYLAPWLAAKDAPGVGHEPSGGQMIEMTLPRDREEAEDLLRSTVGASA